MPSAPALGEPRTARVERGRDRLSAVRAPLAVLGLAAAVTAYVGSVNPHTAGHYPTCPFLAVTGLHCPGCGSLRALHDLAHGDLWSAIGLNLLAVATVPLMAFWWLRWLRRLRLPSLGAARATLAHPLPGWLLLAAIVVFWVARNLPVGAALAP
jgi:hypothetical protein